LLLLLLLGRSLVELLVVLVLIGGDLVRKHAATRHVSLGVVVIEDNLNGWVIEAALLRLVVVRFVRGKLWRSRSLRVSATRRDRGGVRARRAAVAKTRRGTRCRHVSHVLGCWSSRSGVATGRSRAVVSSWSVVGLFLLSPLLAVSDLPGMSLGNLVAEGLKEVVEIPVKVLLSNAKVPLKEEEELLLHQVDLCAAEAKVVALGGDVAVVGPVLVLWWAVVEVLSGEDESSEKNAMGGASKTASHRLKLWLEAAQVDESGHESRDLNVRGDNELCDELLKGR
jgi:hypothetical protein